MPVAPGYLRNQGLPQTTGQRGLPSVQINDYIGQAISQGAQVTQAIGGQLLEAQQASEVSTATVNAQIKLHQAETDASSKESTRANTEFLADKKTIYDNASSLITSKRGRAEFDKTWNVLSTKSQLAIQSAGTKRHIQKLESTLYNNIDNLARGLDVDGKTRIDHNIATSTAESLIAAAVKTKVLDAPKAAKLFLKLRGTFAKSGLNSLIRKSKLEDLQDLSIQMAADNFASDSHEAEMWSVLDDTERLAMQTKVNAAYERHVNILEKREVQTVSGVKRNQAAEFGGHMQNIISSRRSIEGTDSVEAPTKMQLLNDLQKNKISFQQYQKLETALENRDPIGNTDTAVAGFIKEIREAGSKNEIIATIKKMEKAIGRNGTISFEDFEKLEKRALGAVPNTPGEQRKTLYSKAITKVLGSVDFLDTILPGAKQRAGAVILDFEGRLADGEDPQKAFEAALDAFNTRQKVNLRSIPRPQYGSKEPLSEWSLEDVEDSIALTKSRFSGSPNTLATQLLSLNALRSYIKQQIKIKADAASADQSAPTTKDNLESARDGTK